ncbi:bifunctional diaminohydroxyphosphoribosylaminopyrimidine deaminase/5-amino-6-(5-phosphoribosylamino)uracil reductase RibD [Treponema ruminis]|uniref:Riboflavin biosynthesis protein RibD n=1 Tax=Treponema ruminis TaxID=744515 RepID=A0A7W8GB59_9SPIR|nr:bifunctional diaminohydroxyphosphoribosylaminopyrimidine deaminase/5-amino-6-(5-phosphoribosylamino)uracil reductase RibD [Treponema ruminis]MBB5227171.1 diaminohydroxyphosphoribosylaminopyrimidine deaminase/5-amino-6-(5-phosphoribosylamino)uracil reductase [Treponema ruminis]
MNMSESLSKEYMLRAIELAKKGKGRTNPNPLVGAVIVKNEKIIGQGWHHAYGDLHAEREALKDCYQKGENPEGATIYVTLEPCCHFGKQPPCTQAILESKIAHVVVGSRDPNPLVHGKGNAFLREHGILVDEDFLREECDQLNPIFFHYISSKMPYVALKYAMTLDGKIATKTGESKWISGEKSRQFVHQLRNRYAGILAGIGTVLKDDPMLNCRLQDENGQMTGRNPVRIICDSDLSIPLESKIVKSAGEIQTIVACLAPADSQKKALLEREGVEVLEVKGGNRHGLLAKAKTMVQNNPKPQVNLYELMKILGEKKIDSLLIEGGGAINFSALEAKIVQKIYAFVSPKIFGGVAKSPVGGEGVSLPDQAFGFKIEKVSQIGEDVLLELEANN